MPTGFLSDSERERLSGFPAEVPSEDLFSYFTLDGSDRALVPVRSAPSNRLGFALALCAVRYLGFCPEDLSAAPEGVLWYVSEQLGVPAAARKGHGERAQTRTEHLGTIYAHLGFRRATDRDLRELAGWLVRRALEHDDPALLLRTAAQRLREQKVVRPGVTVLERLVAAARERAGERTFQALSPLLTEEHKAGLDGLLVPDAPGGPEASFAPGV
jgi:TnpA family transposase